MLRVNDRDASLMCSAHTHEAHREETGMHADDVDAPLTQETRDGTSRPQSRKTDDVGDREVPAIRANVDILLSASAGLVRNRQDDDLVAKLRQRHRQMVNVRLQTA